MGFYATSWHRMCMNTVLCVDTGLLYERTVHVKPCDTVAGHFDTSDIHSAPGLLYGSGDFSPVS